MGKKPQGGGLSAVGGNSDYTYYKPTDAKYKGLVEKLYADIPELLPSLGLAGEPLPLLWTCDYIPKNPDDWELGPYDRSCGGDKTLADVPDEDYFDACELTNLMGVKAIEMLDDALQSQRSDARQGERQVSSDESVTRVLLPWLHRCSSATVPLMSSPPWPRATLSQLLPND